MTGFCFVHCFSHVLSLGLFLPSFNKALFEVLENYLNNTTFGVNKCSMRKIKRVQDFWLSFPKRKKKMFGHLPNFNDI